MTASSSSARAPMAAERRGSRGENGEGMSLGMPQGAYPRPRHRDAAARHARSCVGAPDRAAATSCSDWQGGRRQVRWAGLQVSIG